jgi:hypothetical protein
MEAGCNGGPKGFIHYLFCDNRFFKETKITFNCNFRLVYCSAWRRTYGKYFDGKVKLKVTEELNDTKVKLKERIPSL